MILFVILLGKTKWEKKEISSQANSRNWSDMLALADGGAYAGLE